MVCLCCFTFANFCHIDKNINKHSYQSYIWSSDTTLDLLWIEYCKNQKHSTILFYLYPLAKWNLQWRVLYMLVLLEIVLHNPDNRKIHNKIRQFIFLWRAINKTFRAKLWNEFSFLTLECSDFHGRAGQVGELRAKSLQWSLEVSFFKSEIEACP